MSARILVLNCFVKGWNILKRLADDGFEVNGGDYRRHAPGLFSNRIKDKSKNLIYPDPKKFENEFVAAVLEHISQEKFDIVLPVNAAEMMALACHREEITRHALFPFDNYYKLLLLHDKKYFFELLSGILDDQYLPHSWSIGNQTLSISDIISKAELPPLTYQVMENYSTAGDFIDGQPELNYPLVVKTRRATSSVGVYRVNNGHDLQKACDKLGGVDIIIQENLIGRGVGISSIRWDTPEQMHHFGHKRVSYLRRRLHQPGTVGL
jgi:hypothetical protein